MSWGSVCPRCCKSRVSLAWQCRWWTPTPQCAWFPSAFKSQQHRRRWRWHYQRPPAGTIARKPQSHKWYFGLHDPVACD